MFVEPRPEFPASSLPEDPADQRLVGVYPQRQEGRLLQRIRIPGGRLSVEQWRAIADAAEKVDARPKLHLTTRQCLEIHDLTAETVPALQALLAAAALSSVGAAGDTVRNFTVDPEGGLTPGTWDLMPLVGAMTAAVEALPGIWSLPRKFKVSLSSSERARMRPWTSDVGIIAEEDGSLTAIVAGSLGAKPGTGLRFDRGLTTLEAVALVVAAVRLHALEGDRENRRSARLRHVRTRMGDAAFVDRLRALHAEELAKVWPESARPVLPPATPKEHVRLTIRHGDLAISDLRGLLDAVQAEGGAIRIGLEHDLHVFGVALKRLPAPLQAWSTGGRLVACPGTALCSKAAAPTREVSDVLAPVAADHPGLLFAISGCPNSCAHATVADVGLVGCMKRVGDDRVPYYTIYRGGANGAGPELAVPVGDPLPISEVAHKIRSLLGE